jgi:hypothetical protein
MRRTGTGMLALAVCAWLGNSGCATHYVFDGMRGAIRKAQIDSLVVSYGTPDTRHFRRRGGDDLADLSSSEGAIVGRRLRDSERDALVVAACAAHPVRSEDVLEAYALNGGHGAATALIVVKRDDEAYVLERTSEGWVRFQASVDRHAPSASEALAGVLPHVPLLVGATALDATLVPFYSVMLVACFVEGPPGLNFRT